LPITVSTMPGEDRD